MIIKFTACKYLDFRPNYSGCKRQLLGNNSKLFWLRKTYHYTEASMVQFCKLRGRLNNPECCLYDSAAMCSKYEKKEHNVRVSKKELEE